MRRQPSYVRNVLLANTSDKYLVDKVRMKLVVNSGGDRVDSVQNAKRCKTISTVCFENFAYKSIPDFALAHAGITVVEECSSAS